jgi:hypothetical protein
MTTHHCGNLHIVDLRVQGIPAERGAQIPVFEVKQGVTRERSPCNAYQQLSDEPTVNDALAMPLELGPFHVVVNAMRISAHGR